MHDIIRVEDDKVSMDVGLKFSIKLIKKLFSKSVAFSVNLGYFKPERPP
jgi:hypothetical protein